MIRTLIIFFLSTFMFSAIAQQRQAIKINSKSDNHSIIEGKSVGDTLLFFDGKDFLLGNSADQNDFLVENIDLDTLNPHNTIHPMAFEYSAYTLDPSQFMPSDKDTAWFIYATSWFSPTAQANNWFTFGPISIPLGGADFSWYAKHNPHWTDSYSILLSDQGGEPITDLNPSSSIHLFDQVQVSPPAMQTAQDSVWTMHNLTLDAFAGQRIYIGIQHNAYDGDVVYLDHMLILESDRVGIEENSNKQLNLEQSFPNPAKDMVVINYQITKSSEVQLSITDVLGNIVYRKDLQHNLAGEHSVQVDCSSLNSGVYFYTLQTETTKQTRKLIVE